MHHAHRLIRALLVVALPLLAAAGALVGAAAPADAQARTSVYGVITVAYQYRDGTISVEGYAFDRNHPTKTTAVCIVVDGACKRIIYPHYPSPYFDKAHHITGPHRFHVFIGAQRPGAPLVLRTHAAHPVRLAAHFVDSPGMRIVSVARRFVGHARYTYGGASPRSGFDCSGYVMYAYQQANVADLPHQSEQQRHVAYMHHITRAQARPGDLVFYFDGGGGAFHVAIYAGHGYQYSAADPADGIRYQPIWSSNVEFRTDWH